jgi:hypothetical protein
MKIMATHTSATTRQQTPHANQTTRTAAIIDTLKRRAQAVLNDKSIDAQSRAIIRYGLETNDPWLAELVRRADAGESIGDTIDFSQLPETCEVESTFENSEHDSSKERIEALAEIICRAGDESAGALLVLMGTLATSANAKALANMAKHFAFTRCGELNLFGMIDAQIATVERELLTADTLMS